MPTILAVYGTRPEALKLAKVVDAARGRGIDVRTVYTNQSPDLHPDHILWPDFIVPVGVLPESLLLPALVVVQGDTRTAMYAALRAYELGIPVFHVEAGVRTGDLKNPWPEEGYRQAISRIATYHACSTERCLDALRDEGQARCRITGNPIVESVRQRATAPYTSIWSAPAMGALRVLVTLHRRESGGRFLEVWEGIEAGLAGIEYEMKWPTHPNMLARIGAPRWAYDQAIPPLAPDAFASALNAADLLITDSGGNQEEANALGVRCVVARDTTDRKESLGRGGAFLGGRTAETLAPAIRAALAMDRGAIDRTAFGDGLASQRIADWFVEILS